MAVPRASLPTTPAALAHQLAHIARRIKAAIMEMGEEQPETADMYAQTLVYTLFAHALLGSRDSAAPPHRHSPLATDITNIISALAPLLDECRCLLEQIDLGAVLAGFGSETHRRDAVMHFYETFLASYNPAQRARRGVYSTPAPVVSYMVRSVDELLRQSFACPHGLADERVLIFDPATGTATFPHAIVQHIHAALFAEEGGTQWDTYLRANLLPRLYGFEVMMAPCTIAHLKLALLLAQLGCPLASSEQPHIYLANALARGAPPLPAPADYPLLVVIGNPPYSNYLHEAGSTRGTLNASAWIEGELRDYKRGLNERKLNLDDTFIKFMRAGQVWVEQRSAGILAFITSNTYLDGITHRRMRQSLMESFTHIYLLNLHGHTRKQERSPDGRRDENVFDIQQGVAIGFFVRSPRTAGAGGTKIHHADVWGSRTEKYSFLARSSAATTPWHTIAPTQPFFFFAPRRPGTGRASEEEYLSWWSLAAIFPLQQNSIKTDRDRLFVDMDRAALAERMRRFYSDEGLRSPFRETYRVENSSSYHLLERRRKTAFNPDNIRPCLYRPFDVRWLYYAPGLTSRPAWEVMRHMLAGPNLALAGMRQYDYQVPTYCYILAVEHIIESRLFLSNRGGASIFPLYCYADDAAAPGAETRQPNLAPAFVAAAEQCLGLRFAPDGRGNLATTFGPDDLFHYLYALLHSPTYRRRYADLLKRDYPRVPLPGSRALFAALAVWGGTLVDLHLLRLPGSGGMGGLGGAEVLASPAHQGVSFHGSTENGSVPVGSVAYQPGRVLPGGKWEVRGVPPAAWELHIGGYRPLAKWLRERHGQMLGTAEQQHFARMVVALRETCSLAWEIDAMLVSALGWEQRERV